MRRLLLLDRDGVLNEDTQTGITRWQDWRWIDGSLWAIAQLHQAGFKLALVTNQSVVGKGLINASQLDAIHEAMQRDIIHAGGKLDAIFCCTDAPDAANSRRKPSPAMLQEAMAHFGMAKDETLMIGDDLRDLQAAHAAGCAAILVQTGKGTAVAAAAAWGAASPQAIYDHLAAVQEALCAA